MDRWAVVMLNMAAGEQLAVVSRHWTRRGALAFCQEMSRIAWLAGGTGETYIDYRVQRIERPIPDAEDSWSGNWGVEIR